MPPAPTTASKYVAEIANDIDSCDRNQPRVDKRPITETEISTELVAIIDGIPKDASEETFQELKRKHGELLDRPGERKMTLLHELAHKRMAHAGHEKFAVWLLKTYPRLILEVDEDDHTAFYVAVERNNNFAIWILREDEKILADFQKIELDLYKNKFQGEERARGKGTHLHMAIQKNFERTRELIEKSNKAIFRVKDMDGNTPLHNAINRSSTKPDMLKIVDLLFKKYPDAIFERNKANLSPYDCLQSCRFSSERDDMLDKMKFHCLHEKPRQQAIDFLYMGIEGISIFY
jgi:ankyrin repeat protein